jgi:hypothetical protein
MIGARSFERSRFSRLAAFLALAVAGIAVVVVVATLAFAPASVTLEESGVHVELRYTGGDRGEVVAVFHPVDAGFHLYGPELPREGINGAGRPTLLEVSAGSAWHATGPLVAEPATTLVLVPSFDRAFPIFPDGPATLRLPLERDASAPDTELTVSVTYMACSFNVCRAPVIEREIRVPTRS